MKAYRIENTMSGKDLGVYHGEDEDAALRTMYRDAGYEDTADIPGGFWPADITVTEIEDERGNRV